MIGGRLNRLLVSSAKAGTLVLALSFSVFAQGKNPVILIPGITGSELRHKDTNERIWFRAFKSKSEDIRLPIFLDVTKNHDDLVPGDILREAKLGPFPITDVYGSFIKALEILGGYHEEKWNEPSEEGYQDSLYVFPYDWRLDNVQNARLLVRKVEALKIKLKKPELRFDVVAHSMGGIITRYAAMYGDIDLPTGNKKPLPTWAGAKLFDKVILIATPNEGAAVALSSLAEGFTISGKRIDMPFLHDTSKFTLFTLPSVYQLLPAPGTLRAFDEKLKPIPIDIYDARVWVKYGWSAMDDKDFAHEFKGTDRKDAAAYFVAALGRAKRLHEALSAGNGETSGIAINVVGADCGTALDAIVVIEDKKAGKWKALFQPKGFTASDGRKVSVGELKKVMYLPGDGVVTERSLRASTAPDEGETRSSVGSRSDAFICGEHYKMATNTRIQEYVIGVLSKPTAMSDRDK